MKRVCLALLDATSEGESRAISARERCSYSSRDGAVNSHEKAKETKTAGSPNHGSVGQVTLDRPVDVQGNGVASVRRRISKDLGPFDAT